MYVDVVASQSSVVFPDTLYMYTQSGVRQVSRQEVEDIGGCNCAL